MTYRERNNAFQFVIIMQINGTCPDLAKQGRVPGVLVVLTGASRVRGERYGVLLGLRIHLLALGDDSDPRNHYRGL